MSLTIGRCVLVDPDDVESDGDRVTFTVDIFPTVAGDLDEMKARRQQLSGLAHNADEEVVPVVWSEDPTFDGFYRVLGVSVPSNEVQLSTGFIPGCQVTLERLTGFANPWFEVTVNSVVRTNVHSITVPVGVAAATVPPPSSLSPEVELPSAFGASSISRTIDGTVATISLRMVTAPLAAASSYRFLNSAATFYDGACKVEVKYGSTWYPVVGRDIPTNTVWRISNGIVRLTSANGATAGTFEVFASSWESQNVRHINWTGSAATIGIGDGNGSIQSTLQILRNSSEAVVVRCSGNQRSFIYSIQRGERLVSVAWTADAVSRFGVGFSSATACTAVGTGAIRKTTDDANGNQMIFGMASAATQDVTNGYLYSTDAATSGQHFIGCILNGTSATGSEVAAEIRDQWFGRSSLAQRVIVR